jgi:hypothetical protein
MRFFIYCEKYDINCNDSSKAAQIDANKFKRLYRFKLYTSCMVRVHVGIMDFLMKMRVYTSKTLPNKYTWCIYIQGTYLIIFTFVNSSQIQTVQFTLQLLLPISSQKITINYLPFWGTSVMFIFYSILFYLTSNDSFLPNIPVIGKEFSRKCEYFFWISVPRK